MARRGQRQTGARRTAPRNQRRGRDRDDVISVLARAVREVEAAAERGRVTPAVRTKFQVVALLVREEHARVRAEETSSDDPPGRAAQAPRRDRDDPREDRRPRPRRSSRSSPRTPSSPTRPGRSSGTCCGPPASSRPPTRPRRRSPRPPRHHRAPGRAAVGRLAAAGQPLPRPRLLRRPAERGPAAPPGRLGAARPAAQLVRARRRRSLGVHGPARAVLPARAGRPGADAAPGAGGRRGRGRPPDLPARRRAGPGQDGSGAARRGGGERLPAARGRAERRQDQLGARGRPAGRPTARPP